MSTFTEHYNLIMPSTEDYYDVQDFNENTEALDTLLFEQENAIANVGEKVDGVSDKIGNPGDEGEDTLFGVLEKRGGDKIYAASHQQKFSLPTTTIVNSAEMKGGIIKLTRFVAKHSGTISISLATTSSTQGSGNVVFFRCAENFPTTHRTAPDLSNMNAEGYSPFLSVDMRVGTATVNVDLSVEKGKAYVFYITYSQQTLFQLTYFHISYDEMDTE